MAASALAQSAAVPIIDSHIHLFDPTRPQGVPWPAKDDKVLYRPALPARYRKIVRPFGITGAIVVECSPWVEDNQWVLDVAAKNKIIVGMVGNLEPGKREFRAQLDRFHRNPLFLGIRYGNLWDRNLAAELGNPAFVSGLKELAEAGLVLDTANQNAELIAAALRITDLVPNLRIVIDHLPQFVERSAGIDASLRELGQRPKVYVKMSEVLRRVDGRVATDLNSYRANLDELFGIFGEDRVLFGSDWPNSDNWAPFSQIFGVVHEYFTAKGHAIAGKHFRRNSIAAYRWMPRS